MLIYTPHIQWSGSRTKTLEEVRNLALFNSSGLSSHGLPGIRITEVRSMKYTTPSVWTMNEFFAQACISILLCSPFPSPDCPPASDYLTQLAGASVSSQNTNWIGWQSTDFTHNAVPAGEGSITLSCRPGQRGAWRNSWQRSVQPWNRPLSQPTSTTGLTSSSGGESIIPLAITTPATHPCPGE